MSISDTEEGSFYKLARALKQFRFSSDTVQDYKALFHAVASNAFFHGRVRPEPFYGKEGIIACELLTELWTPSDMSFDGAPVRIDIEQASKQSHMLGVDSLFDAVTMTNGLKRFPVLHGGAFKNVPVTLNASPNFLLSDRFGSFIEKLDSRGFLKRGQLWLEILEHPIEKSLLTNKASMRRLEEMVEEGFFKLALDDYEYGNRSNSRAKNDMHKLHFETFLHLLHAVKYEGKFSRKYLDHGDDALLYTIEDTKRQLPDALTIVEHVDNFEEARHLHDDCGVDAVQGMYLNDIHYQIYLSSRRLAEAAEYVHVER